MAHKELKYAADARSDGARRMYGIGDKLPAVYAGRLRTQIYNE
jgi:hypothetical protein